MADSNKAKVDSGIKGKETGGKGGKSKEAGKVGRTPEAVKPNADGGIKAEG